MIPPPIRRRYTIALALGLLFGIAVAFLVLAATAEARVDGYPRVTDASVPEPDVAAVIYAPCPYWGDDAASGCAYLSEATIYVSPRAFLWHGLILPHEKGHLYDWQRLDDVERARFKELVGQVGVPWWNWTPDPRGPAVAETFADAYASCQLGEWIDWGAGYRPIVSQVPLVDVCRFIVKVW